MSLFDYSNGTPNVNILPTGCGSMDGAFGGNGAWWILVLFLFAFAGNGFGNGFGSNCNAYAGEMQRGFDQQTIMGGINGINSGLANAEVSRCNSSANTINAINNLAAQQQNCCCENRLAIANLVSTIQAENFANRTEIANGVRDLLGATQAQTQSILDKMCQDKIESKNETIAQLRQDLYMSNLMASQTAQTAQLINALSPYSQANTCCS